MKALRVLFENKDKKTVYYLMIAFIVGLLLLIMGNSLNTAPKNIADANAPIEKELTQETKDDSYESKLEQRMEAALSEVEGVGRVKVMITMAYSRETIVGSDSITSQSSTKESDAGGGSRETITNSSESKTIIITDRSGESKPLLLKEAEPTVEGVIIVAEGGDNIFIKDALTRASSAILGIEANKVQILKMKSRNALSK